jgi:sigma-B regulation protein RsbU (phosphoserine phosphatase)
MRLLIAEDDPVSRRVLQATLGRWGYDLLAASDGDEAWRVLTRPEPPDLAILDWMMPGMDGVEICRRLRSRPERSPVYLILLTAKGDREDIVEGLQAGADDYITKPFDRDELRARLQVGVRVVELQRSLAERVRELEDALSRVKQLQGLLPICSYCKKIRDDQNYWQQVENYVGERSEAKFSHSICPSCYDKFLKPEIQALGQSRRPENGGQSEIAEPASSAECKQ